jgi:hypothetical protein
MYVCTLLLPILIITKASGKFKLTYIEPSYGCLLKINYLYMALCVYQLKAGTYWDGSVTEYV